MVNRPLVDAARGPATCVRAAGGVISVLLAVTLLAGCGSDDGDGAAQDPAEAMLANLPDCDRVPLEDDPEIDPDVPGLVLPDGARITSVLEQGPLTTVDGTIRMTPLDVRADYENRDDVELLRVEDEIFEAEVLVRADGLRMYVLAAALCDDGTSITAVIGPDSEDAGLPEFRSDHG
ncbi:hypothetical protein [Phytoactinopolyspora limicola]|uniref:hypothetical protein n=1 Tax=Phytoactinopolyspora limicola TaxID=2715536 RepID=UPI00140DE74C|nr:hypothetical protein [Phytoactinopolyspora limicola]